MYRSPEEIKKDMLDNISNTEDKSENSFIHDAIAPASLEVFTMNRKIEGTGNKIDIEYLEGGELDRFIYQRTLIERKLSTYSSVNLRINGGIGAVVNEGIVAEAGDIGFVVDETKIIGEDGYVEVKATSEVDGSSGNVPANSIDSFRESIEGLTDVINLEPATGGYDEEDDESFIERYYERVRTPSTSGNKYHYINWAKEVEGVGDAKVIPLWNGNGTVKVIIVDGVKKPASGDLIGKTLDLINDKRPIGADITVVSAASNDIGVKANISVASDSTIQVIQGEFKEELDRYRQSIAFKESYVSYAAIGNILFNLDGVLDYEGLKLNDLSKNIALGNEEVPVFNQVDLEVI